MYACPWGNRNENIKNKIDNIKLKLVSQVILIDNGTDQTVDTNYLLIKDITNQWIVYVEELFTQIANTTNIEIPDQLGRLFQDIEGRKFLVEKYFVTIDVLNQIPQNEIRNNLAEVLGLQYEAIELNAIGFHKFSKEDNNKAIIEIFTSHNLDIDSIKEKGFEYTSYIDLTPWYKTKIREYISDNEILYQNKLFATYQNKEK